MKYLLIILLLIPTFAYSATVYVDEDCADGNTFTDCSTCTGGDGEVYDTIAEGITNASATDTVYVCGGTYYENITISKALTLQGELDVNGDRLSVIDPYVDISYNCVGDQCLDSSAWTLDSDGVYTKNIGYRPMFYVVEKGGTRYKVDRMCQLDDPEANASTYCDDWSTDLYRDTDEDFWVMFYNYGKYINFWWGIHALGSSDVDGHLWFKFDNEANVNNETILIPNSTATSNDATILITTSNVTIKDFSILASDHGVLAIGDDIEVDNNEIYLGGVKVYIIGDNATITDNNFHDQSYAYDYVGTYNPGPWSIVGGCSGAGGYYNPPTNTIEICTDGEMSDSAAVNRNLYSFTKYSVTPDNGNSTSSGIWFSGYTATASGNTFYKVRKAFLGVTRWTAELTINNNDTSHTYAGAITLYGSAGSDSTHIHDNTFTHTEYMLRFQEWDGDIGYGGKDGIGRNYSNVYVYGNKSRNVVGEGYHFKIHYLGATGSASIQNVGTAWFYHNSFSGGAAFFNISENANSWSPDGTGNITFIDNIISTDKVKEGPFYGDCLYNWEAGTDQCGGTGSYDNGTTLMWDADTAHDFIIPVPDGNDALEAGVDITESPYSLPGFESGYFYPKTSPDMGIANLGNPTSLSILQPDGVGDTILVGASYNITYTLVDTDDVVTVDFYYDAVYGGFNGTAIDANDTACQDVAESIPPSSATCAWDTTGMTPGTYYVYGIVTGGSSSQIYSSGIITINDDSNAAPTINIDDPDGSGDSVTQGDNYTVIYDLADTDDVVNADFYYDNNSIGYDGIAITGCANQGVGANQTCLWNTSGVTPGTYYVHGDVDDGTNPPVTTYSGGQVTINAQVGSGSASHMGDIKGVFK